MKRNFKSEVVGKEGVTQESHPELLDLAHCLGIDVGELKDWMYRKDLPTELFDSFISLTKRYRLNPLLGHLDWELLPDTGYEIFITIDGWITLIHQETSFAGITFTQSGETEDGVPLWMECSIYRTNLIQPITVREYYAELKTEHPIWERMPRRMLRHKTLQQCARLAFGIAVPEIKITPTAPMTGMGVETSTATFAVQSLNTNQSTKLLNQKIILKQQLIKSA